jgi:hypothetical protein
MFWPAGFQLLSVLHQILTQIHVFVLYFTGISFWDVTILKSCAKHNTFCDRCHKMNYGVQIVLFYMGIGILVARPVQLMYGFIHNEAVIDVIPSLTNTVVYSFLSLEYLTDFSSLKHKSIAQE